MRAPARHFAPALRCRSLALAGRASLLLGLVLGLGLAGCATPRAMWRPAPGEAAVPLHVIATGRHTVLSLPSADPARPGWDDWAYGEMVWFYEDRNAVLEGLTWTLHRVKGVFRALFWPSAGVLEIVHDPQPFAAREGYAYLHQWTFELAPAHAAALRAWLAASARPGAVPLYDDGQTRYLASRDDYHVFHTCHHWAGRALRSAGVPAGGRLRCLLPWPFWRQLDRLEAAQTPLNKTQAPE